jgi:hypothetical protein
MSSYLLLPLILACPLMMVFMMRGMHGGHGGNADGQAHGHGGCGHGHSDRAASPSLDELRRRRDELEQQIEEREEEKTPVGGGWR